MKTTSQNTTREDREAAALRENLARRKAQSRSRATTSAGAKQESAHQEEVPPQPEQLKCR